METLSQSAIIYREQESRQKERSMLTSAVRANQLDILLREAANIVGHKLRYILQPGVNGEAVGLSYHIQAGVVNHFREIDEFSPRPNAPEPEGDLVERTTIDAMRVLKLRLEMALVESFHGVVSLTIIGNGGQANVKCCGEKVRKAAALRA